MRILATVEEVYHEFKDVAVFHGMGPFGGALSELPGSMTFSERIGATIENSRTEKVWAFSIRFCQDEIKNRIFGLAGIGIGKGKIFRHYRSDSGLTNKSVHGCFVRDSDSIDDVINRDGSEHNEFILTDIEPCCIYYFEATPFPRDELLEASRNHKLPICALTENGLRFL